MDVEDAKSDVAEAAVALDQVFAGWDQRVDLEQFSLWDPRKCVLFYANGMTNGAYSIGERKLTEAGFYLRPGIFASDGSYLAAWRELIWTRQHPEAAEFNRLCAEEEEKIKQEEKRAKLMVMSMLIVSTIMTLWT